MITLKELYGQNTVAEIPIQAQQNMDDLLPRLNKVRAAWGKPMTVTSGFRSMQQHMDIHWIKALRERRPFSNLQVPLNSRHLTGQACDFADPDGTLYKWAEANVALLESAGLYCEQGTKGWLHCQSVAPRSGKRFFLP